MGEHKMPTSKNMLLLALCAFLGIAAEIAVVFIERFFFHMDFLSPDYTAPVIHYTILSILWGVWAYFVYFYAKEAAGFNVLEPFSRPKRNHVMLSLYIFVITITLSSAVNSWHIKPVAELFHTMDIYGQNWIPVFTMKNISYVVECALMCLILSFAQKAGDLRTSKKNIPWGGIFLSLSWGIWKVVTLGPPKGPAFMVLALCYGLGFLLMQKNIKYGYAIILLMYLF